jgi:hypothetical protein
MLNENSHPTDQELLLTADGELPARRAKAVHAHLSACWHCRARMSEMEAAIVDFVRVHHEALDGELPPIDCSRSQLSARLSELVAKPQASSSRAFFQFMCTRYSTVYLCFGLFAASVFLALLIGRPLRSLLSAHSPISAAASVEGGIEPDPKLTPGATRQVSIHDVCAMPHEEVVVDVPNALREKILQEYGILENRGADYEIDFLISPGLGGTEDVQNLWPEPYASDAWNAHVKDELEEHLHELVCSGKLELTKAQKDISADWIGAYKKYFNSDRPIRLRTQVGGNSLDSQSSKQNRSTKMWLSGLKILKKVRA